MSFVEHEELITALLAGWWWAVMEIEDHLHSSCEKGECGVLPTDQEIEAQQGAPVPFSSKQEVSVPSRTPKGPTVPEESQREVPVLSRNLKWATISDRSEHEAPVPPLRQKLKILENMRQYLTVMNPVHGLPLTHHKRLLAHHMDSCTTLTVALHLRLQFPSPIALMIHALNTQLIALNTLLIALNIQLIALITQPT